MSPRVGIIGLGGIGTHHAERLPDGMLVAGLDHSKHTRDRFTERFSVPTYNVEDADDFYASVDAAIVCVPNKFHEPYATECMARDIDVLVEKPLAHTTESAERIVETADMANVTCMVGFNNRYAMDAVDLRRKIESSELGRVTHVEANYVRRDHVPRGWFTDPEISGGGVLLDLGVHVIDLALHLLGRPTVLDTHGEAHSLHPSSPVDDMAHVSIDTADTPASISINTGWGVGGEDFEVTVYGSDGVESFELLTGEVDTHQIEQRDWLDQIDRGDEGNVREALAVQRIVDDVYRDSHVDTPAEMPEAVIEQ